jgi:hypothetical protein
MVSLDWYSESRLLKRRHKRSHANTVVYTEYLQNQFKTSLPVYRKKKNARRSSLVAPEIVKSIVVAVQCVVDIDRN